MFTNPRNKVVISRITRLLLFTDHEKYTDSVVPDSRQLKIGVHGSRKSPLPTLFVRPHANCAQKETF